MPSALTRGIRQSSSLARHATRRKPRERSTGVLIGDQLGPIQQDAHQSFRLRSDGTRLPLPPMLDPVVIEQKFRWKQNKEQPHVDKLTPFQRKLWENPYAHALASPCRQCVITGITLPEKLLITLHPRPHPETGDLWLLPVSLTTKDKHLGTPYRFVNRRLLVEQLHFKGRWKAGLYHRLATKLGKKVDKIVWREDMPELILTLLRKKLVEKLRWFFNGSLSFVPCASPRAQDIEHVEDVTCVLYFGTLKTHADEIQAQANAILTEATDIAKYYTTKYLEQLDPHKAKGVTHNPPGWWKGPVVPRLQPRVMFPPLEFRTTVWRGQHVAVYSLYDLLGEEKLQELLKGSLYEKERCLVVRRARNKVMPVTLLLAQLQSYLANTGP